MKHITQDLDDPKAALLMNPSNDGGRLDSPSKFSVPLATVSFLLFVVALFAAVSLDVKQTYHELNLLEHHNAQREMEVSKEQHPVDRNLRVSGTISVGKIRGKLPNDEEETEVPTTRAVYSSSYGVFDVSLPLFSGDLATPYNTIDELGADMTKVFQLLANHIISSSSGGQFRYPPIFEIDGPDVGGDEESDQPSADGATDYETNNQEEGVDEADLVKSDGIYVYTAYGDTVVVWKALSGEVITNLTMTPIDEEDEEILPESGARRQPWWASSHINGLLLPKHSSRLVVIVNDYQYIYRSQDILNGINSTRMVVYSTASLNTTQELVLVHETDVNGYYRDARSLGNNTHIVTTSWLNTWNCFESQLYRYNEEYYGLNDTEYETAAKDVAMTIIPRCVSQLIDEIIVHGNVTLARVGVWQTSLSAYDTLEDMIYANGALVVNTYTQITSFDVTDDSEELGLSLSGAFMPSSWGYTYTVAGQGPDKPGMLVFAAQGWNWMQSINGTGETTYFMGFTLNETMATPAVVGSLPGYLLNQYSMDIVDGTLRAATTIRSFWTIREPEPGEIGIFPIFQQTTKNQVVFLKIPTRDSENPGVFEEIGRIPNLGKEGEVFTTVRFFDEIAYAVTFLQTDPFYVLNVSDPTNPGVLGELNVTGFSSYLHPVNSNNTLLLAVGQEADLRGRVLGVKVTLYDASDPTNPLVVQNYTVEQDQNVWSSTDVSWDVKAFRYLSLGVEVGLLILPLRIYDGRHYEANFDGFLVLDVSRQGISQRFNISHASREEFFGCYYWATLPQRSLVFDGNVTTLKGKTVLSTDLDTGDLTWKLNLLTPQNPKDCFVW